MVLQLAVWVLYMSEVGLVVLIAYLFAYCEWAFCYFDLFAWFMRFCVYCGIVATWWCCWFIDLPICLGCCLVFI